MNKFAISLSAALTVLLSVSCKTKHTDSASLSATHQKAGAVERSNLEASKLPYDLKWKNGLSLKNQEKGASGSSLGLQGISSFVGYSSEKSPAPTLEKDGYNATDSYRLRLSNISENGVKVVIYYTSTEEVGAKDGLDSLPVTTESWANGTMIESCPLYSINLDDNVLMTKLSAGNADTLLSYEFKNKPVMVRVLDANNNILQRADFVKKTDSDLIHPYKNESREVASGNFEVGMSGTASNIKGNTVFGLAFKNIPSGATHLKIFIQPYNELHQVGKDIEVDGRSTFHDDSKWAFNDTKIIVHVFNNKAKIAEANFKYGSVSSSQDSTSSSMEPSVGAPTGEGTFKVSSVKKSESDAMQGFKFENIPAGATQIGLFLFDTDSTSSAFSLQAVNGRSIFETTSKWALEGRDVYIRAFNGDTPVGEKVKLLGN